MRQVKIDFPKYAQSAAAHLYYAALFCYGLLPEQKGIVPNLTRCQADVMPNDCVCGPCRTQRGQRFVSGSAKWIAQKGRATEHRLLEGLAKFEAAEQRSVLPGLRERAWERRKAELRNYTYAEAIAEAGKIREREQITWCGALEIFDPLTSRSHTYSPGNGFGRTYSAAYRDGNGKWQDRFIHPEPGDYALRYITGRDVDGPDWETVGVVTVAANVAAEENAA